MAISVYLCIYTHMGKYRYLCIWTYLYIIWIHIDISIWMGSHSDIWNQSFQVNTVTGMSTPASCSRAVTTLAHQLSVHKVQNCSENPWWGCVTAHMDYFYQSSAFSWWQFLHFLQHSFLPIGIVPRHPQHHFQATASNPSSQEAAGPGSRWGVRIIPR